MPLCLEHSLASLHRERKVGHASYSYADNSRTRGLVPQGFEFVWCVRSRLRGSWAAKRVLGMSDALCKSQGVNDRNTHLRKGHGMRLLLQSLHCGEYFGIGGWFCMLHGQGCPGGNRIQMQPGTCTCARAPLADSHWCASTRNLCSQFCLGKSCVTAVLSV